MQNQRLAALLDVLRRADARILHLIPGHVPHLRMGGRVLPIDAAPWSGDEIGEFARDLLFADHRQQLQRDGFVEVMYVAPDGRRFRATVTDHSGQTGLVLQAFGAQPTPLAELCLPQQVGALAQGRAGLLVVAGGFGSGCEATFHAVVGAWNEDVSRHVVALEASITCTHPPAAALLHQRQIGVHVASAADGVAQALAVGVDSLALERARDAADLDAVLGAAEAGCAVLLGAGAGSVVGALQELLGLVDLEFRARARTRLARVLRGVVAQHVVADRGPAGRATVAEVLVATGGVRAALRAGNLHDLPSLMARGRGHGMQTREMALAELAK